MRYLEDLQNNQDLGGANEIKDLLSRRAIFGDADNGG